MPSSSMCRMLYWPLSAAGERADRRFRFSNLQRCRWKRVGRLIQKIQTLFLFVKRLLGYLRNSVVNCLQWRGQSPITYQYLPDQIFFSIKKNGH